MPTDLGRAMNRLTHRDIRTRRRAVRDLYEHDRPEALEGFVTLLNDDDPWFVAKAIEAHRKWAPMVGVESVDVLLKHPELHVRQAGVNLLAEFGEDAVEAAQGVLLNKDTLVHHQAALVVLRWGSDEDRRALATHSNPIVRRAVFARPGLPFDMLEQGLNDADDDVQRLALQGLLRDGHAVESDVVLPYLNQTSPTPELVWWVTQHWSDALSDVLSRLNGTDRKALASLLRSNVSSSKDLHVENFKRAGGHDVLAKWVLHQGQHEDALRWDLVDDESLGLIDRSILLERLIGRANEPSVKQRVETMLNSDLNPLLRVACENLSTAAAELDA